MIKTSQPVLRNLPAPGANDPLMSRISNRHGHRVTGFLSGGDLRDPRRMPRDLSRFIPPLPRAAGVFHPRLFVPGAAPAGVFRQTAAAGDTPPLPGSAAPRGMLRRTVFSVLMEETMMTAEEGRRWSREAEKAQAQPITVAVREWHRSGESHKIERLKILIREIHDSPYYNPAEVTSLEPELAALIPFDRALVYMAIPVGRNGDVLNVIMCEPFNVMLVDDLARAVGYRIQALFAPEHEIKLAHARLYAGDEEQALSVASPEAGERIELGRSRSIVTDVTALRGAGIEAFVTRVLVQAHDLGASDVHFERQEGRLRIRLRKDGELRPLLSNEKEKTFAPHTAEVISRLIVAAGMKIDRTHLPQDGRISVTVKQGEAVVRAFDCRVVLTPTVHGPAMTVRIQRKEDYKLERLGLAPAPLEALRQAVQAVNGLVLVTGPTGSGKTTTLYALLNELNKPEVKIWTVEDPVEREIDGYNQVAIERGLTFADVMRNFLRADPDIILVGEIRDPETAAMAIQASSTGHLVLSSLHTNDAISTAERLVQLGVKDYEVADNLRAVVAQRLTSRICLHCRESVDNAEKVLSGLGVANAAGARVNLCRGKGCDRCGKCGHEGRIGVYEVVPANADLLAYVAGFSKGKASRDELEAQLKERGVSLFRDAATQLLLQGIISPEGFQEVLGAAG